MHNFYTIAKLAMFGTLLNCLVTPATYASKTQISYPAGFQEITYQASHHAVTVNGALWYPATVDTGDSTRIGENPVFHGTDVYSNASVQPGNHPVVLLSHGLGGHWRTLAWLGTALAQHGAIVIAVDHPNSTARNFNMLKGLEHGTRVKDLQQALTHVQQTMEFNAVMDEERLYVSGFSYGGWTALSMAGVQGNLDGYAAHCDLAGDTSSHCADLARAGIQLNQLDGALWNASYRDSRVSAVAAIDPGLLYGVMQVDIETLSANVTLIGLGDSEHRLLATDFSDAGNGFLSLLQSTKTAEQAQAVQVTPANHYSALPSCKPAGPAILEEEGDDPVCDDPEGADRQLIHEQIINAVITAFKL